MHHESVHATWITQPTSSRQIVGSISMWPSSSPTCSPWAPPATTPSSTACSTRPSELSLLSLVRVPQKQECKQGCETRTWRARNTSRRNQLEKLEAAKAAWLVCLSLLSLTESFLILLGPSGPYLALLSLTGPYSALLSLTGPCWALRSLT